MGLRERNAERTRELVLDTAARLFSEQGYDTTTMEQVAEAAQIGTSTLYRYFPTKDLLVLEPIALHGQMAAELTARPSDEPLDRALGHALTALLATPRGDADRLARLGRVIEGTASLQGRLVQAYQEERRLLARAIAERLGRPDDDVFCEATAHVVTAVLEMAATRSGPGGQRDDGRDDGRSEDGVLAAARSLAQALADEPPVVPVLD